MCQNAMVAGRRCTITTGVGETTAPSIASFRPCRSAWIERGESIGICGVSTARRSVRPELPPALEKSLVQHSREPADHALGRSRGGWGSKFHLVTDGRGLPLAVEVTAGQRHESTQVEAVMDGIAVPQPIGRPRKRPKRLAGDKGYSYPTIRRWLRAHGINGPAIIFHGPRPQGSKL